MTSRALILGCAGKTLLPEEASFFRDAQPWGFILFKRNIGTPDEVRALTAALRDCVGRAEAPILIDQEGGRVQRMGPPHWPKYPAGGSYGRLNGSAETIARLGARLIAHDLAEVGINVDCAPVLDVPSPGSHDIIGDRAYGDSPEAVAAIGRAVAEGLMAGGVLPVVKHMPGHGRAACDSHKGLPVVDAALADLRGRDFAPFRLLADLPMAMSAHVVFTAIDPDRPATQSPVVIRDIVRGEIGFDGLLMTDDLSMHALTGRSAPAPKPPSRRGSTSPCTATGKWTRCGPSARARPLLTGDAARRAEAALARLGSLGDGLDLPEARARFAAAFAEAA